MSDLIPTKDETDLNKNEPERYVQLYESADKVYLRKISGFYQTIRRYTGIPLLLGFILLPWLMIDGRPAVWFDLPTRHFHILWATFSPEDGIFLAGLLIIGMFALFTVTILLGRVWCGFTCPQTVWTLIFVWVERLCEGERNKRIKLDKQGWSKEKLLRKSAKHSAWMMIGLLTGLTFIGYFVPVRELIVSFIPTHDDGYWTWSQPAALFWVFLVGGLTYLNAGWMREQVCKYMCPYARFQSVMYDKDTLAVHYDAKRGESRGPRKVKEDYKAAGKGDCIDCSWCVQVCPVDIDIRDGLQYECINCGLCVDACNSVMDKMEYPRGLIRFTSEDALEGGKTQILRPRLIIYTFALLGMIALYLSLLGAREPLSVDINRDRGTLYRDRGGKISNVYTARIHNMDNEPHEYRIEILSELPFTLRYRRIYLEAGEVFTVPVTMSLPKTHVTGAKTEVRLRIESIEDNELHIIDTTTFIAPVK